MNQSQKSIVPFIMMVTMTILSSCSDSLTSSTTVNRETPVVITSQSSPRPSMVQPSSEKLTVIKSLLLKESPTSSAADKSINVTLYTSDIECQQLIPKQVTVPAVEPITSAVGKIIEQQDSADFSVSGYRVTIKNGVATVDLRISPKSQRQFTSLSSCEQFALFGSLRKTLTSNPQWQIKKVRFTELGKEITF
jgi:hypothetical protein